MARGKKKNRSKLGDDSDDDEDDKNKAVPAAPAAAAEPQPSKGAARKAKRNAKQAAKKPNDSDSDNDDAVAGLAAMIGGKKNQFGIDSDQEDDDDDDDEAPRHAKPAAKGRNKKKGGRAAALAAAFESSEEEEEDEEKEEEEKEEDEDVTMEDEANGGDDDDEEEEVAVMIADDDWGASKKKKKKEEKKAKKDKEKKEKKHKKEKKKKKDSSEKDDSEEEAEEPPKEERQKTKFELQMEAAMKKKGEDAPPKPPEDKKTDPKKAVEVEPDWVDTTKKAHKGDDDEELEDYYGHGDEAWTDKSHALKEAEKGESLKEEDLLFGPDGKKLSNKERKKVLKAREAAKREEEFQASAAQASREGAQFACSQTNVDENDPQWENSLDVNVPNFSISAAGKILFKDAALTIANGRHYGLVGPNGKGKSTLLKMIASKDLKLPPRIDFLYVEQEVVADDTPAVEAVLRADKVRWSLLEEERNLMAAVDAGDESEEKIVRLQEVVDQLTNMGADAAESKARRILYGLGFTPEMQTKPTKMFSGGWRMRISLARALFVEPTLLMLDEPTNHLDLNAVIWLDEYLQKWKKTLLVVSHDQDFLNSVCQEILHIEDLKLISYKGNYDNFKKAEHIKFEQRQKDWEKQEKRLRELKKSGMSRDKAIETVKKSLQQKGQSNRSKKKKDQLIAAGTETAETVELLARPREYQVKFEFAEVQELTRPVIEVNNVHFRYSPRHPIIFDCVDFGIDMDSRVTIVGPNGAGKTTLLKLLTGELEPTTGEVRRNSRLRMGIYNQHFVDKLPMDKTPVQFLRDEFPEEDYQSIRNRLGKYGLEGHAHEVTMRDLSGGQKARVTFVQLSLQRPHVLLFDEPTNNLDVESIDALCAAINEFEGGVVVVTHDQRLIEECNCTLWVVEKRGVTEWKEGFDDYKQSILQELEDQIERENAERNKKLEAAAVARAEKLARLASKVKKK